mgnify:CR=1 FL=1
MKQWNLTKTIPKNKIRLMEEKRDEAQIAKKNAQVKNWIKNNKGKISSVISALLGFLAGDFGILDAIKTILFGI